MASVAGETQGDGQAREARWSASDDGGGRTLIVRLAKDYPRWGADRIHGALVKLGVRLGATTVQATAQQANK